MPSTFQNASDGLLIDAVMTVGAEAANAISVTIQLEDRLNGNTIGESVGIEWFLASDVAGSTVASAPDSGAAAETSSGTLIEWTANVAGLLFTNSNGAAKLTLTHSSTGTWYLVLKMPDGKKMVSGAITFS